MANIFDLEKRVKEIYAKDPTDPELYIAIRELAERLLVVKKIALNRDEAQEISHNLATDLYLAVSNGFQIVCWTKYVWKKLYKYREKYLNENKKQVLHIPEISKQEEFKAIHHGSRNYFREIEFFEVEDLINSMPAYIKEVFKHYCRYDESTPEYTNLFLSVLATVAAGDGQVVIINLPAHLENYIRLLSRIIIRECYSYVKKYIDTTGSYRFTNDFVKYFEVVNLD